jgi:uncharacterized protein YbaP (TraB family)
MMMRSALPVKQLFSILVLLGISCYSVAQQSVLIRWVPENSSTASYILGVLHHENSTSYSLSNVPDEVFPLVNSVAFEWLPETYELEQAFTVMQLREDKSLKKTYKREDNIRYELMILNTLQENVDKYAKVTPLFTMQVFREHFMGAGRSYQEQQLYQYALDNTKPVLSLLSQRQIAEQMFLMDFETQAEVLSAYVNNQESFQLFESDKWQLYKQQDISTLALAVAGVEHPAYLQTMRTGLNQILVEKMRFLSSNQSVLYVLDVERLGGEGGILSMLRSANAQVVDMPFTLTSSTELEDFYTGANTDDNYVDAFPEELLAALQPDPSDDSRNRIILMNELEAQHLPAKALMDPFGDRYDHLMSDTSFIHDWYELRSNDAFFTIKMPEKTKWEETLTESINGPIRTNTANVNHARSDLFYSIGYTIYPPNFNLDQKAAFFDDFIYRSIRKMNGSLLAQRIISHPEYSGREFVVMVNDSFYVRSVIILRGNILYQLLNGGPDDKPYSPYAEEFLRSFRLDKGKTTNWFSQVETAISCDFPRQPFIQNQSYNTQYGPLQVRTFNAEDFNDGLSYFLSINTYPPGYKFKSDKEFYAELISDAERQYFGRAVTTTNVKKGKHKGKEVVLQLNNGKVYQMHFFIVDQVVYQYLVGGAATSLQSSNARYFLDHFVFIEE